MAMGVRFITKILRLIILQYVLPFFHVSAHLVLYIIMYEETMDNW